MNILVLGASGKVGRKVVKELLSRGHIVRAFVYSGGLPVHKNLELVRGDARNPDDINKAINEVGVVVSCLGSWGTKHKNVLSEAMKNIVPAMEKQGIERIVTLTGNAARLPNEKLPSMLRISRIALSLFQGKILKDGEEHLRILSESRLEWTVVRSGVMLPGKNQKYTLNSESGSLVISRSAVVQAMCDLAETTDWSRQAPFIYRN